MDTPAARSTIDDLAERVGTARVLTWIHAAIFVTDGMHWAVFGARAISLRLAAVHIRITHVVRRALTHWFIRRTGNAKRSRMTGVRTARFHGDALDVGHRIRAQSRWTLADRSMIVCDANGIHPASVLVAGVVTGVREPVAELRRWTVDVVDAGNRATPGC